MARYSDQYSVKYTGPISSDSVTARCPRCHATRGLTVYGRLGQAGRLKCERGHHFDYPPGIDAVTSLALAARDFHAGRTR